MNKYYTPEIEEFHVGFEYEYKDRFPDRWVQGKLEDLEDITNAVGWDGSIDTYLPFDRSRFPENFRVKYLDAEDIEDLGWEPSPDEPDERFDSFKGDNSYQLYYQKPYEEGSWIEIYESNVIFQGCIKNKCELKRVMKMLGIDV